jgi:hypothetical protein
VQAPLQGDGGVFHPQSNSIGNLARAYCDVLGSRMAHQPGHFSCEDFGRQGRERGVEAYPLHGHQTDNVSVITLASVADLSCAFSSSNTIKSNSASVIPSGRQMLTRLAT